MKKTYRVTFEITIDPKDDKIITPSKIKYAIETMLTNQVLGSVSVPRIQQPTFTLEELEKLGRL